MTKISFAVIGGGPAAFYISKLLARLGCQPAVDLYQKELCPFGLLRYGVAPDHLSIKRSQLTLSQAANYPLFRYFGNCPINENGLKQLKQKYSGIIYAYGASGNHSPKWLNQQKAKNNPYIRYARDIVYWYNGHPDKQNTRQNLEKVKNVVIVGNGNVAIDIARIFLRKPSELQKTQLARNALQELKRSDIQNIQILGRRGVTHSAFSIKEIRQLHKLGIKLYAIQEQLEESMTAASQIQCTSIGDHFSSVVRMNKRKIAFIKESFSIIKESQIQKEKEKPFKKIFFRYLLNPVKLSSEISIACQKMALHGEPFKQYSKPVLDSKQVILNFDLLVISTGFQVEPINYDHYDNVNKKVHNSDGCVIKSSGNIQVGSYATGWCKTGPKGVIDETLLGCEQTVNNIRIHVQNKLLQAKPQPQQPPNSIPFDKYLKIRQIQLSKGNKQKFIKHKLSNKQLIQFYGLNMNITEGKNIQRK